MMQRRSARLLIAAIVASCGVMCFSRAKIAAAVPPPQAAGQPAVPAQAAAPAAKKTDVFFYPPVYVMPDGSRTGSPMTFGVAQATTQVPMVPEMAGVKVISYWSLLCPAPTSCNFDMLTQILDYWRAQHKKVILDVATWGLPFRWAENGGYGIKNATPDWVIGSVTTFTETAAVLFNTAIGAPKISAVFPAYWDPRFVNHVRDLADRLRPLDGNPALAELEIPIGLLGEDSPNLPGISPDNAVNQRHVPGFTFLNYIQYAKAVSEIYIRDFKRTPLVVDLGGVPTIYVTADAAAKRAADDYIDYLIANHVMLAFDGWQSAVAGALQPVASGSPDSKAWARILYYMKLARTRGDQIGLEVMGPTAGVFPDRQAGLTVLQAIAPDRVVMMKDSDAALYNRRHGPDAAHPTLLQDAGSNAAATADFTEQVLKTLGH